MKALLPPDGGPLTVYSGTFTDGLGQLPAHLVLIEVDGGPVLTLTPQQWNDLVRRIRAARTATDIGA